MARGNNVAVSLRLLAQRDAPVLRPMRSQIDDLPTRAFITRCHFTDRASPREQRTSLSPELGSASYAHVVIRKIRP